MMVEDEDVLMIWDMPGIADSKDSILHPRNWFKPFNRSDCQDHLPFEK
jgi:hypothetical protein